MSLRSTRSRIRTDTVEILSLLSLPLDYTGKVGNAGFEPATSALSARCSTTELISLEAEVVGFEPTDTL
jgi:hypothetical protein